MINNHFNDKNYKNFRSNAILTIQEQITASLVKENNPQSNNTLFYAEQSLSLKDIKIHVNGIGDLNLPLDQKTIDQLITQSNHALFGLGEKTLLDKTVRDTHEIRTSQLDVVINSTTWHTLLSSLQPLLGLDKNNSKLTAHLHNMLIYKPGQFFETHQDTEKMPGMVATLVMVLPSAHIGGNLCLYHQQQQHIFLSENLNETDIKCIAFYADCLHKVEAVRQGYRVVLTYNIVLESCLPEKITGANPALTETLRTYFESTDDELDKEPSKFVYLLDHSYSEHSLRWDMLKGADCANATAFYQTAHELGLCIHLALANIHESWSTDGDEEDPHHQELLFTEVLLDFWVNSDNQRCDLDRCHISDNELYYTKNTEDFSPIETEYEGFKGNYGNTADYWYRRAAVILWDKGNDCKLQFKLNHANAMASLLELTKQPGNAEKIKKTLTQAGEYGYNRHLNHNDDNLNQFIKLALYINEEEWALSLLSCFYWQDINLNTVVSLANLQKCYGDNMLEHLLTVWKKKMSPPDRLIMYIDKVIEILRQHNVGNNVILLILNTQYNVTCFQDTRDIGWNWDRLKKQLAKKLNNITQLLDAAVRLRNFSLVQCITKHIANRPELYPLGHLANWLIQSSLSHTQEDSKFYAPFNKYIIDTIDQQLAIGLRDENDWSIPVKLSCQCQYCQAAEAFLHSKNKIEHIWPIAAAIRQHVTDSLTKFDLSIDISVLKTGSPHKLVLVKTPELHQKAHKLFNTLTHYRQQLEIISIKSEKPKRKSVNSK